VLLEALELLVNILTRQRRFVVSFYGDLGSNLRRFSSLSRFANSRSGNLLRALRRFGRFGGLSCCNARVNLRRLRSKR
jgi:hypothetical protein